MADSDTELLDRWRAGDVVAGQELVERYYQRIDRFFANKVSVQAPDLVQQTFEACVRGRDRVRDSQKFRSYLFSIAYRVLYDHLENKYQQRDLAEREDVTMQALDPGPRSLLIDRQEQRLLLEGLRNIPVALQCVLELFYWEQLGVKQIAEILDIPSGTVQSRLFRAREKLEHAVTRLADSPEQLRSTLSGLDTWAHRCRLVLGRTAERQTGGADNPARP